jgi:hypothetical protein
MHFALRGVDDGQIATAIPFSGKLVFKALRDPTDSSKRFLLVDLCDSHRLPCTSRSLKFE